MAVVALLLGLGVLIGLVAIAFDGGSLLLQRRMMVNGAEAGVLAGVELMSREGNVVVSCDPRPPCRPTYLVRNREVTAVVEEFTRANRGGTVGATEDSYHTLIEYHFMNHPAIEWANTYSATTRFDPEHFVPEYVDGLRVTTFIDNPTTFARAIPNPIDTLQVSGKAAAGIFPTCDPPDEAAPTIPFTRFRPTLEWEINGGRANRSCDPFEFWSPNSDIGGAGNDSWASTVSFNAFTAYETQFGDAEQLLSGFDERSGYDSQNGPPEGSLKNFMHPDNYGYENPCATDGSNCADLRGTRDTSPNGAVQDLQNWIFWQWRGLVSTTAVRVGALPGDWAETPYGGVQGQNIQGAVYQMADKWGETLPLSRERAQGGLNWGKAIRARVYVWGDTESVLAQEENRGNSAQTIRRDTVTCPPGQSPPCYVYSWQPATINGGCSAGGCSFSSNVPIQRVRFTDSYPFLFYANLQDSNKGAIAPPACSSFNLSGSTARGFLVNERLPGPPPGGGTCGAGWRPGGSLYYRQIPP